MTSASEDSDQSPSSGSASEAGEGQPPEGLGPLAQMLLSQDRNAISAAIASASGAASLSDIRYSTQRGIFSSRILDAMGLQRLRDDLDELTTTNPSLAERLRGALDALREAVRDTVSQGLALYAREEAENLRNEILRNAPLARIERRQVAEMRALIRQIARRLRERYSKPRKRQRRGHLDVRRTLRRNAAWGGIPFLTAWKRKHRDRPKIVAICDVSGSVAQVSDFFLLLIHSLHEVVDDVHSFAFSSHLIEVSEILEKKSPEEAMAEIMSKVGFGSSDYGSSLVDFEHDFMSTLTPQTTVIVLGDARSNNLDPARRHPAPHLRTLETTGLAQPRRTARVGLWRFRDAALCDLLQRGAAMRHRATARARGLRHRCDLPVSPQLTANVSFAQAPHERHCTRESDKQFRRARAVPIPGLA